ncbi:MAG: nucleotidyltransferase [Syntrophomonadaceae bacterium]|nr:nucleotidyltransferase [Syntrophomonadaceae bacterium]
MAVLGIVAEYNPFHNGHLHLLNEANKAADFSATVCVMSGNFLQRGEPAICDKWARAEMALKCGVDLVIELPFCFAVRSAYHFAKNAVELLYRTGVVTHIAFGSESGHIHTLKTLATLLTNEPEQYKALLKKYLSQGLSFPLARSRALQHFLGNDISKLHEVLSGPNNILAIEYLRAIEERNIPLIPLTVARKGSAYHSTDLSKYASATAIRKALTKNNGIEVVTAALPPSSLDILTREIRSGHAPVLFNSLEQAILAKLRTISTNDLKAIYEVSEGLEHRFKNAATSCSTLDELRQLVKSKRYNLTRINRTLLYSLFNLTKNQAHLFDQHGPLYLHILGFSTKGQKILQKIKIKSQVKIFHRGRDIKDAFDENQDNVLGNMVCLDVRATDVYSLLLPNIKARKGGKDFTTSPVMA